MCISLMSGFPGLPYLQLCVVVKLFLEAGAAQPQILNADQAIIIKQLSKEHSRREILAEEMACQQAFQAARRGLQETAATLSS